jgi:hypothetical protein
MSNQVYPSNQNQHLLAAHAVQTQTQLEIRDAGIPVTVRNDKYYEYNFFVKQYNNDANRIEEKYMFPVPISRTARSNSCVMNTCLIICAIIPYLCILILIFTTLRMYYLIRINKIVRRNRRIIPNPLKNMVYCPEINGLNVYLDITPNTLIQQLSVLGISSESFNTAAAHLRYNSITGGTVRVMFYSNQFASFNSNVSSDLGMKICIGLTIWIESLVMTFLWFTYWKFKF